MDTKNGFLMPAFALAICAVAAPLAVGSPVEAKIRANKISVKMSKRAPSIRVNATPFVLFKPVPTTPATGSPTPADKPAADKPAGAAPGKGSADHPLNESTNPQPIILRNLSRSGRS